MTDGPSTSPEVIARRLAQHITVFTAPTGAVLCAAGAPADHVLFVIQGTVESTGTSQLHARELIAAAPGASFFPHTVRARTDVRCGRLPTHALVSEGIQASLGDVAPRVFEVLHRRDLVAQASAVFGTLDEAALTQIERESEWIDLKRGDVLMRQGEQGDRVFVLLAGRLQASHTEPDGRTRVVGDIAAGETVGEMSFFTGETRSATVRAIRDSLLIALARPTVEQLIASRPEALRHVIKVQIDRVRRANRRRPVRAPLTNIAVVPLSDDVPVAEFTHALTAALASLGETLRLDPRTLDQRLNRPGLADSPEDGPDMPWLAAALEELERSVRFVVYETSARVPGWLARSVSRADAVLLVGRAGGDPGPTAIEALVAREEGAQGAAQHLLVLLHDADGTPSGTAAWLATRKIDRHHHVRIARPDDLDRVARFLAGRAVGLVLGAGGARGFAHIGVLRALHEAGVPIDMVGGTSMGAGVAAQHAMGWTPERMIEVADRVWNQLRPHTEYTLPLLAVLRGRRQQVCGELMYGSTTIEDLWLPYFAVTSDLTDATMRVLRAGALLDAVQASSSPPGVALPTRHGTHLLWDGSLFNTLPGGVAREMGCDQVIASRVSVPADRDFEYDTAVPSLRTVLRHKLLRRPIRYPGLMGVLLRSSMIAAVGEENREAAAADLLFSPPVDAFGLMQFDALPGIVEVGYRHAVAQISAWEQAGRFADVPHGKTR